MYKSPNQTKPLTDPYETQQSLLRLRDEVTYRRNYMSAEEILLKINSCLNSTYTPTVPIHMLAIVESQIK